VETLVVILLVAAAGVLISRSFIKNLKGKGSCGECKSKCEAESRGCGKVE